MAYTMEDFRRDYAKEQFSRLTPEEREDRLRSLTPEQRLAGLTPEQVEEMRQHLERLAAGRPAPHKPGRKSDGNVGRLSRLPFHKTISHPPRVGVRLSLAAP